MCPSKENCGYIFFYFSDESKCDGEVRESLVIDKCYLFSLSYRISLHPHQLPILNIFLFFKYRTFTNCKYIFFLWFWQWMIWPSLIFHFVTETFFAEMEMPILIVLWLTKYKPHSCQSIVIFSQLYACKDSNLWPDGDKLEFLSSDCNPISLFLYYFIVLTWIDLTVYQFHVKMYISR